MPRRARPWYRRGCSMFFVQIKGKKYPLGVTDRKDRAGADVAHQELIKQLASQVAANLATPPQTPNAGPTVAQAVAAFLARADSKAARGKIEANSVRNYRIFLKSLEAVHGTRRLGELTAEDFEIWAAKPRWSSSYQHDALGCVGSLLKANKVILDPPIQRPPTESRGAEVCLTDEQFRQVLANLYLKGGKSRGDLKELLTLLRECGARPGEVTGLEVESIDWNNACQILKKHKNKKKTGRNKPLHFNRAAMAVLECQRTKYGTGLLFRTRGGNKAYGPNVIAKQLLIVSKRVGFRVIAYGARHSFATRCLERGVYPAVVAALLGTSIAMIDKHYGHLGDSAKVCKDAAEKATCAKAG